MTPDAATLERYADVIGKQVGRIRIPYDAPIDADDLRSIASYAALKAVGSHVPGAGASERTWVSNAVRMALLDAVDGYSAFLRVDISPLEEDERSGVTDLADGKPSPELLTLLMELRDAASMLPCDEAAAVLEDEPVEALGVTRQRVHQLRERALDRLRKRLKEV